MMSAVFLLAVAGITVVWSLERISRKKIRRTPSYEVTAVIDAGYLARRTEFALQAPAHVDEVRDEPARSLRDMEDDENRCAGIVRRPAFSDQSPSADALTVRRP